MQLQATNRSLGTDLSKGNSSNGTGAATALASTKGIDRVAGLGSTSQTTVLSPVTVYRTNSSAIQQVSLTDKHGNVRPFDTLKAAAVVAAISPALVASATEAVVNEFAVPTSALGVIASVGSQSMNADVKNDISAVAVSFAKVVPELSKDGMDQLIPVLVELADNEGTVLNDETLVKLLEKGDNDVKKLLSQAVAKLSLSAADVTALD